MANARVIRWGIVMATLAFALDQLSKWLLLDVMGIAQRPPVEVFPGFNLVMVWNTGISFGMLSGSAAPLFFITLSLVIMAVIAVWLWRANSVFIAVATGLILGGAAGNVVDRLRFGAVADFFDFYLGNYHWPAFNIADSAIVIGVVLLCIEGILGPSDKKP